MNRFAIRRRHGLSWLASGLMFIQTVVPIGATYADGGGLAGVSGGTVVAGNATIDNSGSTLNVNTSSNRTIINWNGFSIGSGETANFFQPGRNSAVLNRVTTPNNPSAIYGALNSNGNVILVNPSGIVVGASGIVNTNGFTASVLDIPNNEFLQGGVLNFRGNSTASVINEGTIKTGTGGAALIGGDVINNGKITSDGGSISLVTGGSVTLADGSRFTHADMATIESGISPTAGLIRNSGTIRATGAMETGGEVFLVNPGGRIMHDGTIAAYRQNDNQVVGGEVRVAAKGGTAEIGGQINVNGTSGGRVTVEADTVELAGASIDASGSNAGGQVNIGGGFQGKDASITNATRTTVDAATSIKADATTNGDGGQVVVWSDDATDFHGTISSRGGLNGGNGGTVEVSGAALIFGGDVDTSAAMGSAGWLLLDPVGIHIVSGPNGRPSTGTDPVLTLTDGTLTSVLRFNNVLLATSDSETNVVVDPGGINQGRGGSGANDDNIVVGVGTQVDTGTNTLFFSTSTVDLYADIIGNVAGGTASNTTLEGFVIKDPSVVNVHDAGSTTGSIQDAVDIIGGGGTINVGDGIFDGGVVIDKSLSLLGDGFTNTSLISVGSNSAGFTVTGDNVLIDGFLFQRDGNASNTVGVQVGELFNQASNTTIRNSGFNGLTTGIVGRNVEENLTVSGVVMRDIGLRGIDIQNPLGLDEEILIEGSDIESDREAVRFLSSLNGTGVTIRSSRIVSDESDAIRFARPIRGSVVTIGGASSSDANVIRGDDEGIDFDDNVTLSQIQVVGNQTVEGGDDAIRFGGTLFLSDVTIADNEVVGGGDGLFFDNVALSKVTLAGNTVQLGSAGAGLRLHYSFDSELEIGPGNSFDGGADGIVLNGRSNADLSLTGNTINDTAFNNQTGDYIRLEDTALFSPGNPTIIDAKDATFEGLKGSEMTAAQLFATEDKMVHFPDDSSLGLIDISELFVVQGESIQLAVNAAGALGGSQQVVVGTGTFGGSIEVWVDDLTLTGNGDSTVIDTDQVDAFANNGDRNTGFELTASSSSAGGGFLDKLSIDDVTIEGFAFRGTGDTSGIVLGQGNRQADDALIRNSSFNNLRDGIVGVNLDDTTTISDVTMSRINRHGVHIRPNLAADDSVTIQDSRITSRRESVQFDGFLGGANVLIRGNDIVSNTRDAVQFSNGLLGANVLIGGTGPGDANRLVGERRGVDFESSVSLSGISLLGNELISGGENAIRTDGNVSLSRIDIAGNERIISTGGDAILFASPIRDSVVNIGATLVNLGNGIELVDGNGVIRGRDDGINVDAIETSLFTVADNRRLEGQLGSGIEFDDTIDDSAVTVGGNRRILGGEEGIEFDTEIKDSIVTIAANHEITGSDNAGIQFKGDLDDTLVGVAFNDDILGGEIGIRFDGRVDESLVRIANNRSIVGEDLAGIRFLNDVDDSAVQILDNRSILGDRFGIDFDDSVDAGTIRITGNRAIIGDRDSGIRFDQDVDGSSVVIADNRDIAGGDYGIEFDGAVENSLVAVENNRRIEGDDVSGISFRHGIESSVAYLSRNGVIRGGDDGIEFEGIDASYVEIKRNRSIRGGSASGIGVYDDVEDSTLKIARNRGIQGDEFGIVFDGDIDDSSVTIRRNEVLANDDAAVAFLDSVEDSTVKVVRNRMESDRGDGVLVDAPVDDSILRIRRNRIEARDEGIQFRDDVVDSDVKIKKNDMRVGGTGIAFGNQTFGIPQIRDSEVVIAKNRVDALGNNLPNFGISFEAITGDSTVNVRGNIVRDAAFDGLVLEDFLTDDAFLNVANNRFGSKNNPINGNGIEIGLVASGRGVRIANNKVFANRDAIEFDSLILDTNVRIARNHLYSADRDGIALEALIAGDSVVDIIDNRIIADGNGIEAFSVLGDAKLSLIKNTVELTGNGSGIMLWNIDSSEAVLVQGGSTTGGAFGLNVIQGLPASLDGRVVVDGLVVNQAADAGIQFKTYGSNNTLRVTLKNAVTVRGGNDPAEVGMVFDGLGLSLTGNTLGDTRFVGTPGNFIELRNGALFKPGKPTLIDGTGVHWDGLDAFIPSQRQQIIDRIVDFLDDPTLGLIFPGAAPGAADQTYDRFTRYQDYWRTVGSLMGPYAAGTITYPTPTAEVSEGLEGGSDEGQDSDGGEQAADDSPTADGLDLVAN